MFRFSQQKKRQVLDTAVNNQSAPFEDMCLQTLLGDNVKTIASIFTDVDIVKFKYVDSHYDKAMKYCLVYSDGVVDTAIVNDNIIRALIQSPITASGKNLIDTLMNQVLQISEIKKTDQMKEIAEAIASGDTVLLAEGQGQALVLNTKSFQTRAISEPENEKVLSGPREGFTESLLLNLSLLRKRVMTPDLKMKFYTFGQRTQTKACICYFGELVNEKILKELQKRLESIDIDAVLDSNYISELIKDSVVTPIRTMGFTEKPDTVIGKLLEGRIAILVDGTPKALTLPYLFVENFQSDEDYYLNYYYTSFTRIIRILGFLLTVSVPGLFIAIVAFHHEMMPTQLLISIATERQSVPLPAALEAFLMLIVFDILREAGVRMPANIGQALSIVGALVIGQAAVEAKLVAAPMIVVVGLTGITGLLVPKLSAPVIYIRFMLLLFSSVFGFFGFVTGASMVLIHVLNLRSFGIPLVMMSGDLQFQELKDSFIRAPWHQMLLRPKFSKDRQRMNNEKKKQT